VNSQILPVRDDFPVERALDEQTSEIFVMVSGPMAVAGRCHMPKKLNSWTVDYITRIMQGLLVRDVHTIFFSKIP
jgi:hypothetical protein